MAAHPGGAQQNVATMPQHRDNDGNRSMWLA